MNLYKASLSLAVFAVGTVSMAATVGCGGGGGGGGDECAGNFVAGDLVITEVMANPDGQDEGNEYWEIFNPSSSPVDVTGLALFAARADGTDEDVHIMRAATIAPGQYFVVGGVLDEFKPGHVDYGYANDLGSLRNAGGKLGLRCRGTLVDEIEYGEAADGIALELDGSSAPDAIRNDELANFCNATNEFLPDNFGTPQEANGFCTIVAPGMCNDGGTMRATVPPAPGDVVITEFLPDSVGADGDKEWVEALVLADVDLNGLNIGTEEGNPRAAIDSPDCVSVTAGTHILFAQTVDDTLNGGLPAPDGVFGFTLKNGTTSTGDGKLVVGIGQTTLDVVTWTDSTEGQSFNLNPDLSNPTDNDLATSYCAGSTSYGDAGNFGTPKAANTPCLVAGQCLDPGNGQARAINKPQNGELAITEWLANPAGMGTDAAQEWFEVRFDVERDLNGVQVGSDMGTVENTVSSTNCIVIPAGGYAVFARTNDNMVNGMLDAHAETGFALVNTGDRIFVGIDDVELAVIDDYPNATDGAAQQVDNNGLVCDASTEYNMSGNLGTPGADNDPDCNAL